MSITGYNEDNYYPHSRSVLKILMLFIYTIVIASVCQLCLTSWMSVTCHLHEVLIGPAGSVNYCLDNDARAGMAFASLGKVKTFPHVS